MTITGLDEVLRGIEDIRLDLLRSAMSDVLREIAADAADYDKAPLKEGQRYRRSGHLAGGWTDGEPLIRIDGNSILAEKTNPVSYAPFVQGAEDQRDIFEGRWRTDSAIMDEWEDKASDRLEAAIDALVDL